MKSFLFVQNMQEADNFINLYTITDEMLEDCEKYLKEYGEYPKDFGNLLRWLHN